MMATTAVEPQHHASFDPAIIETLREQVGGNVILPGDDGYDEARRVWNGMIAKRRH